MHDLHDLIALAEANAERLEKKGAEYLYDGLYAWHDGFQYWLESSTGQAVALEPRTLKLFLEYLEKRGDLK